MQRQREAVKAHDGDRQAVLGRINVAARGLGVAQAGYFVGKTFGAQQFGGTGSPNWNHTRTSDHPPTPGLWAVEPHVGKDGVGAKFEDILVITETEAFWLDEGGLPHHRAWGEAPVPAPIAAARPN